MCQPANILVLEGDVFSPFTAGQEVDLLELSSSAKLPDELAGQGVIVQDEEGKLYHAYVGIIVEEIEPEAAIDQVPGLTIDRCKVCHEVVTRAEGDDEKKLGEHLRTHAAFAEASDEQVAGQFESLG